MKGEDESGFSLDLKNWTSEGMAVNVNFSNPLNISQSA